MQVVSLLTESSENPFVIVIVCVRMPLFAAKPPALVLVFVQILLDSALSRELHRVFECGQAFPKTTY